VAFTVAQQDAIDHDGHCLIVAGPGSGKTTTFVAKAQRILSNPARRLLMVTFTREGADEMRRRLDEAQVKAGGRKLPEDRLLIGTFHSIALRHLFRHRRKVPVLSPAQQNTFLQDAMGPLAMDPELGKEIRQEFEYFMYAIDRDKVEMSDNASKVVHRYLERLHASRSTDLYTIMRDCALFCDMEEIPPLPYTDMLVDEGQDTDELQKVWIFAHARQGVNVSIVGDDDQSIYEWRHALGYSGMKSFMDSYNARRIELGDNFRCKEEILNHAVVLVQHNKTRLSKRLVARRGNGGSIACYHTGSSEMQCKELARLIVETPDAHRETAILSRQNFGLNDMEYALTEAGVAYSRIGKSIWDNPDVSNYLSFLQSLLDGSPAGIFGVFGLIGIDDAVRMDMLHAMRGDSAAFLSGVLPDLPSATATDVDHLKELGKSCNYWRKQLLAGSVTEVVLDVAEWVGSKHKRRRSKEIIERCAAILGNLSGMLSKRLFFINNSKKNAARSHVTLMTMHGSKGLEFETVHIIDANNPEDSSLLLHLEAERRLMYVAITRAKDRCIAWYNEAPHQTLVEAQLPVKHQYHDLVSMMGGG
jgi:superfamily I DNA/RNA helicase